MRALSNSPSIDLLKKIQINKYHKYWHSNMQSHCYSFTNIATLKWGLSGNLKYLHRKTH